MALILDIRFPADFEERYRAYKALFPINDASSLTETTTDTHDEVSVNTRHGLLKLNKSTGHFTFNDVSNNLNPTSQEFKVLLMLMTSKNHQATYSALVRNVSKDSKRSLSFVVRNLKEALGILPADHAMNEDIIGNVKNLAYKLLL